jgi:hypothetical protein
MHGPQATFPELSAEEAHRIVVATPPDDQPRAWSSIGHTTDYATRGSGATKCLGGATAPFPALRALVLGSKQVRCQTTSLRVFTVCVAVVWHSQVAGCVTGGIMSAERGIRVVMVGTLGQEQSVRTPDKVYWYPVLRTAHE